MLSTNKPRMGYICGKNSYNRASYLELLFWDCFHCLWLQGSNMVLLHCMGHEPRRKVHSLSSKTGIRREFHTFPKASIKSYIKNNSLPEQELGKFH